MRERISKSCGRKRRALPPQCAAVPPTISPGLNAPISRIGSAVCALLLRNVRVSLASSIDMIEPTTPLPTTTTSTGFNFVVDISAFPVAAALGKDVLRKAFRIDRHLTGLDVEHADGCGVVRLSAGDQAAVFAGGHAGESEQLPTHFVAVATIERIGEIPLFGVAPQQIEKEFRG